MLDPVLVAAGTAVAGSAFVAVCVQSWRVHLISKKLNEKQSYLQDSSRVIRNLANQNYQLRVERDAAEDKAEFMARDPLRALSARGHDAKRAKKAAEEAQAKDFTINQIASTQLRPRDVVVAGVRENRPRRQQFGA